MSCEFLTLHVSQLGTGIGGLLKLYYRSLDHGLWHESLCTVQIEVSASLLSPFGGV